MARHLPDRSEDPRIPNASPFDLSLDHEVAPGGRVVLVGWTGRIRDGCRARATRACRAGGSAERQTQQHRHADET
jgi:hypothetical protein